MQAQLLAFVPVVVVDHEVETPYTPWFGFCHGPLKDESMPLNVEALTPTQKPKGNYLLYMPAVMLLVEMCPHLSIESARELVGRESVWLSRGGGPSGFGTGRWILISALADLIRGNLQWMNLKSKESTQ